MDIVRPRAATRQRYLRTVLYAVMGLSAVTLITFGLSRLKPAAPGIERSTVLIEKVQRGPMLRQVRGNGTLVPEEVRIIAAATQGRVERIRVQPGAEVTANSVLLDLSNPELQQSVTDSEYQVKAAQADYNNLKVRLESDRMAQESTTASVRSDYHQSKIQTDTDEVLAKEGLIPALNLKLSRVKTEELANRYRIEQQRLDGSAEAAKAQLASQQARISQLQAQLKLKQTQVQTLSVVAGTNGVLQQMQVEVGQEIAPGTNLAKVVEPQHLKAQLKIPETQARDIQTGQRAEIDTRNGLVPGHVVRIDPAAQQGTVTVDVALDGQLPPGARPDLTVDGTVELERLSDVVFISRPSFGQAQSSVSMFKLEADGQSAVRVQVKLGRSSASTIEVVEGLQPGDQVILSDTSAWDAYQRILLK
jgi:HlyD family secretion protein